MRSRTALFALAVLAAVTAVVMLPAEPARTLGLTRAAAAARPDAPVAVATTERVVALTFDDGPDPRWTPAMLDDLARFGARATFFVTGEHALEHPEIVRRAVAEGHELGNHSFDHPVLTALSRDAVRAQVEQANRALEGLDLPRTSFFRPPKGQLDAEASAGVRDAGMDVVYWTQCLERYVRRHGLEAGVARLVDEVRPGGVLLAHDGGIPNRGRTVQALPLLLEALDARGYRVVPVGELLRLGPTVPGQPGDVRPRARR